MTEHYTSERLEALLKAWDDKPNEPRVLVCDCSLLHLDSDDQEVCRCGRLLLRTQWLLSGEFADVYQSVPPLMRELIAARADISRLLTENRQLISDLAAAVERENRLKVAIRMHRETFPDEPMDGGRKLRGSVDSELANRTRYECKVCGNQPDEQGILRHGKGCYVLSDDGGGEEYVGWEGEQ